MRATMPYDSTVRRRGRALRTTLVVIAVGILVLPLVALGVLRSDRVRTLVRARAEDELQRRLGPVEVGEHLSLDGQGRVTLGPIVLPADGADEPALVEIDRVYLRPRLSALFSGRVEVASVLLEKVRIEAGAGGEGLRTLARRVMERRRGERDGETEPSPTGGSRRLPVVRFRDVEVRLPSGSAGELRAWRIAEGSLVFGAQPSEVELEATLPGGGELGARIQRRTTEIDSTLNAKSADVRELLGPMMERLPLRIDAGKVTAELSVIAPSDLSTGTAKWRGGIAETVLHNERLSADPVGPFEVHSDGEMKWNRADRFIQTEPMRVWIGATPDTAVSLKGQLRMGGDPSFSLSLNAPALDYRALVRALPAALSPGDSVRDIFGTFSVSASAEGPVRRPAEWTLIGAVDPAGLSAKTTRSSALALGGEFVHRMSPTPENERTVRVGPGNPHFVPLDEIPQVMTRAVLISEDVMFLRHGGFDFEGLQTGIASGAGEGQVLRGGSTITQQLAKNLFLSREKRYARKVREAFLTLALEAALSKQRLLEIYLNLIEWGPGLYGVGEAAAHYFAKDARELTIREAAFLATIIPNPVRYHVYCTRGALSEVWEKRVADLLAKLRNTGDITEEQYQEALVAPLTFSHPGKGDRLLFEEQ